MRPAFNVKGLWIRRTTFDKVLRDKASNIAKSPKYIGYQLGIASAVYYLFLLKILWVLLLKAQFFGTNN